MYDWLDGALDDTSCVVTANRRLARVLQQQYASQQLAAGVVAWRTPTILAWQDWLDSRLRGASGQDDLPVRINHHQSTLLWDRCLRRELGEPDSGIANLVRLSRETWQRLSDWNISIRDVARAAHADDHRHFAAAAGRYLGVLEREHWVDDAGLAHLVLSLLAAGRIEARGQYTFAGFDRDRPIVSAIREQLAARGADVRSASTGSPPAESALYAFDTPEAELRAAGAWARELVATAPGARVGIVVSTLEQDAERLAGLVREGLIPGYRLSSEVSAEALNVSYGRRLSSYAAVSTALLWLRWLVRDLRGGEVGHLLRSPLLGMSATAGRARLELRIRGMPDRDWAPSMITGALNGKEEAADATDWLQRVARLTKLRRELPTRVSPAEWALRIDEILEAAGWPGGAVLGSADFQLVNRWRDLLNDLARMDLVSASMTLEGALNQLESMAGDAIFQPEADITQVHLLGTLEASGLEFDALWLTGMTATDWPPRGRASALVSRRLQQDHGMPDAIPEDTVEYAGRLLQHLSCAAPEVVFSYPRMLDDADQTPSDLLDDDVVRAKTAPPDPGRHAAQLPGAPLAVITDRVPPIEDEERLVGGAATIQNQLTDPIAAFIGGRLGARALDVQAQGLPALLRGNLIHDALYQLYLDKPSRDEVAAWSDVAERVAKALDFAFDQRERHADEVLRRLLAMERRRVGGLLREFLALDVEREAFSVESVERKVDFAESGVRLELRIDRIDRVADGRVAIIDYKTGAEKKFVSRKGEPYEYQLVAYACAVDEPIAALALVNVDSRVVGFHGAGAGFSDTETWDDDLATWSRTVRDACAGIAAGDVRINRHQGIDDARPLNLLTRFTELRNDS